MSSMWLRIPTAQLDDRIRELERAAYEHFGLAIREETLAIHTRIGDIDVRVLHTGSEDSQAPPILMLHGVGSFSVLAVEVMSYLADRRIVVLAWPGHGLSGPCAVPGPHALRGLAVSVIEGVLDDLGIPVVDVVAHSLGGQFSVYAALDLPRRIRRIVFLGCPGGAFAGAKPILPMMLLGVPQVGRRLLSSQVTPERFARFNDIANGPNAGAHLPEAVLEACYYLTCRPSYGPSVATYFQALVQGTRLRPAMVVPPEDLERIAQPVLMAWGDLDAFMPPGVAADSIVALRDHRLVRLRGAGHAPWLDEPELVGAAVASHLAGSA